MWANHQADWEPVILRKKKEPAARTETVHKDKTREDRDHARKLERDLDPSFEAPVPKLPVLTVQSRKDLVQARVAKKLSQVQLAQMLNVRPHVVQDLEGGKIVSDRALLNKIRNVLGIPLACTSG
jgi:ribosome-binding protein aMBF1 (putative translation factor)